MPSSESRHYEVHAYSAGGAALRLTPGTDGPDYLTADNIFDAVRLLTTVPHMARSVWEGGETEEAPVARIELVHVGEVTGPRGGHRGWSVPLETIIR
ncbi:hypothetical protein [Streptomyces sp. 5-10]|uniref:hypothetical protein n=1 Tax=Streptomyces sp. 5-10 TaxID=878925 RepID=UPI00168B6D35|nr:hypothetical protein [Streptomyces sp. 5-10]MBD3004894.1 hypothetical protein [Streptomyces sp. 5-10]